MCVSKFIRPYLKANLLKTSHCLLTSVARCGISIVKGIILHCIDTKYLVNSVSFLFGSVSYGKVVWLKPLNKIELS